MQFIDIADKEWKSFTDRLSYERNLSGVFVMRGLSEQISTRVSTLLEETMQDEHSHAYYFLCSGSKDFCLPSYTTILDTSNELNTLTPHDILENSSLVRPQQPFFSPHQAVYHLKNEVFADLEVHQLIIVECLTELNENDQFFITHLVRSVLSSKVPVLIFVHQANDEVSWGNLYLDPLLDDILYILYMCGGCIAKSDVEHLIRDFSHIAEDVKRYLVPRFIKGEIWLTYRNKGLAKCIERKFPALSNERKQALATTILTHLTLKSIYPLFPIASCANDVSLMLSQYSLNTVKMLLHSTRHDLLVYFRKLRRLSRKDKQSDLFVYSTTNYIAMLILEYTQKTAYIYKILCAKYYQTTFTSSILHALFFAMGQILSKSKDTNCLVYAEDCYRRCQMLIKKLLLTDHEAQQAMTVAIENGKALLALKQGNHEGAFQLESSALQRVNAVDVDPQQKILLHTHLGDLFFRSFHEINAAVTEYEKAYSLSLSYPSLEMELYLVPKLSQAYMRIQEYAKAVRALENLLINWKQHPQHRIESRASINLQILLPLAQAFIETKQFHNAALCYLHVFLEPEYVSLAVLKGILLNLKHCLPTQSEYFWMWIEHIITEQEYRLTEIAALHDFLAGI